MFFVLANAQVADLGTQALATVVGLGIGFALLWLRNLRNRRNQPGGENREALIVELNRMREAGAGFHERLDYLCKQGLRKAVAEGLIIDADTESVPDDLQNKQSIQKTWCAFEAPGNWRLGAIDDTLDQESFFAIEAAGSGIVSFSRFPAVEEELDLNQALEDLLEGCREQLRELEVCESFSEWGGFRGRGLRVTGLIKTHPLRASHTLFVMEHGQRLISIQQGGLEQSQSRYRAAYDLISSSMSLNPTVDGHSQS